MKQLFQFFPSSVGVKGRRVQRLHTVRVGPSRGTVVRVENRHTLLFWVDQRACMSSLLVLEHGKPIGLHAWRDDVYSIHPNDLFRSRDRLIPAAKDPNPLLCMLAREHYLPDLSGLRFARDSRGVPMGSDWVCQQCNASPLLGARRQDGRLQELVVRRDWYLHFNQLCDDLRGTIPAFLRAS